MTFLSLISVSISTVPPDYNQALQQTKALKEFAQKQQDYDVSLLADTIQLKILVDSGRWSDVPTILNTLGERMQLRCLVDENENGNTGAFPEINDPFKVAMAIHALALGTLYFTQVGSAKQAASSLASFHTLLDQGALDKFPDGCIEVDFISVCF